MFGKISRFLIKWLLVLFIASLAAFACPRMLPQDPAAALLASRQLEPSAENVARLERAWGLDRPLPVQYGRWLVRFVRGDWGSSLATGLPIREQFAQKLPYSLTVGLGGLLLAAALAYVLALRAALHENGFCDTLSRALSLLAQSVPSFVLVVLIVYVLGVKLGWVRFFTGDGFGSLAIATAVMALYTVGGLARVLKGHFYEQRSATYAVALASRGFTTGEILTRHACKPVLCGLISVCVSKLPSAIGGGSLVEYALGVPGLSVYLVQSMQAADYYVLQSYIMVMALCVFGAHLLLNAALTLLEVQNR